MGINKNKRSILFLLLLLAVNTFVSGQTVKTVTELNNALSTAGHGDVILLANGNWGNADLTFNGNGELGKEIVLKAETPGKVIFTGTSKIHISGSYLELRDIVFRVNSVTKEGSLIEFRGSLGEATHCRLTNVTIEEINSQKNSPDTKWVSLYGTHNRVDHCSFSGKTNSGTTLVVWLDKTPDYHLIDHNYFGPRPLLGVNGAETIRIGTSDWESYSSNCIVENNLFEACNGEIEIISNKSVGNEYRFNTFRNCEGTLTLRHGAYCKVYGNFFFGLSAKNCGGIRIIGEGHEVYNNYLENLEGEEYRAAICLANGVPNSPANRYKQVKKAMVGYNTIVNCKQPFAIGAGKDSEKSLPPESSVIDNNLIVMNSRQKVVTTYDVTDGVIFKGNITNGKTIGLTDASGFQIQDIPVERLNELIRPTSRAIVTKAVSGYFDNLNTDIDGQNRSRMNKTVGCDEQLSSPILIHPLMKSDVGADYSGT